MTQCRVGMAPPTRIQVSGYQSVFAFATVRRGALFFNTSTIVPVSRIFPRSMMSTAYNTSLAVETNTAKSGSDYQLDLDKGYIYRRNNGYDQVHLFHFALSNKLLQGRARQ